MNRQVYKPQSIGLYHFFTKRRGRDSTILLFPEVSSLGKNFPDVGMTNPHTCSCHEEIDLYCPADMWPRKNAREHAELAAMIAERDAVHKPFQQAMEFPVPSWCGSCCRRL